MADPLIIYPTSLTRLSACRLQYHWSRKYKTMAPSSHLTFGIAIHEALAGYYSTGEMPVDIFKVQAKKNNLDDKLTDLGIYMMNNYYIEYAGKEKFKVIAIEKELTRKIPVSKLDKSGRPFDLEVGARIDGIVLDIRLNQYFVLEHKTFDKFYPASLEMDHQFVIEKFVAEGFIGKPISGVIYNGLRKAKHGTVSTKLFERHTLYINQRQTDIALNRIYWTMKNASAPDFHIFPEPSGLKCAMCEFKVPCAAYMKGEDHKFILRNGFTTKTDHKEEVKDNG